MSGLHRGDIVASVGEPLASARVAVVMIHGRGDSAEGILSLARAFTLPGAAYLAPQATNHSWYPNSFLAPIASNEPWLSSALAAVGAVIASIAEAGVPLKRTVLLGFSQGACLATEYAARNARRYGGVVALSGGLIGPEITPGNYTGSFAGTPAFLGCSDVDPHIPVARVHETAGILEELGGEVEKRIYPHFGHTVNEDEIAWVRALLAGFSDD